jgi:hypothetical protein
MEWLLMESWLIRNWLTGSGLARFEPAFSEKFARHKRL